MHLSLAFTLQMSMDQPFLGIALRGNYAMGLQDSGAHGMDEDEDEELDEGEEEGALEAIVYLDSTSDR